MQTGNAYMYEKVILPPQKWLIRETSNYGEDIILDNSLAEGIFQTELDVRFDACCKRLLSEKVIVAWIMKYCISEYRNFTIEEIAEKYIEGTPCVGRAPLYPDEAGCQRIRGVNTEDNSVHEGKITYDVKFRAILPGTGEITEILINIEAQNDFYPGYPLVKRALYYCSRMISSQYGTEFRNGNYYKIKKVYSIWICTNPPEKRENTVTRYKISEENIVGKVREHIKNYDLLAAVMVCLGKEGQEENTERNPLIGMLNVLFSKNLPAEEKIKILADEFKLPMTEKLEGEMSEMCNLSKGIRQEAMEEGWQEGMRQGMQRGMEHGTRKMLLSLVRKKVIRGKELSQIAEELDEPEEYLAPFYRLVRENPELGVDELVLKA